MSDEFVDTNILVYAHSGDEAIKRDIAVALLDRLFQEGSGALSTQVLIEFYWVLNRKLKVSSEHAEQILTDLGQWTIHRPDHSDLLAAARLHRRHQISWWDALVVQSALSLGCSVLWTEDLGDARRFGSLTARNPFTQRHNRRGR